MKYMPEYCDSREKNLYCLETSLIDQLIVFVDRPYTGEKVNIYRHKAWKARVNGQLYTQQNSAVVSHSYIDS